MKTNKSVLCEVTHGEIHLFIRPHGSADVQEQAHGLQTEVSGKEGERGRMWNMALNEEEENNVNTERH